MKPLTPLTGALALLLPATAFAADAPSNLRLTSPFLQSNTIEFAWDDNSDDEDNFEIELRTEENGEPVFTHRVLANQEHDNEIRGGSFGTTLFVRMRALSSASGDSEWTEQRSITFPTTALAILSGEFIHGRVGSAVEPFVPQTFGDATVTGFTVSDLPDGFEFDPATGTISGTPSQPGVFRPIVAATDGVSTASTFVRIGVEPPAPGASLGTPLADRAIELSSPPAPIDLGQHFSAGDVTAFELVTNHGTVDVLAFPHACPLSIANFRNYVGRGDYTGAVFHRSVNSAGAGIDIIQAGWFTPDGNGNYVSIPTDPNLPNEPAFPNDRGTIAMAKLGGDPHSATSQFYFNVTDSPALDSSGNNGGFSVFGRVSTPSLAVIDTIHALPTRAGPATYNITLDDGSRPLPDWPTNTALDAGADTVPGPGDLVQVLSATELTEFLTFAVSGVSSTAVEATVDGSALSLSPRHPGTADVTVTATDLDGGTAESTFTVTVAHTVPVAPAIATVEGTDYPAITFPVDSASPALFEVQKSADLETWTTIWTSAETFTHELVASATTEGTVTTVTVRAAAPQSPCHFRVRTVYPVP